MKSMHVDYTSLQICELTGAIVWLSFVQVSNEEERQNFIEDYRVTACISILQWFCMEYKKHGVAGVEGGPEGQRTQVCLFQRTFGPKIASI